ncbi:unnamed protein product [Protopolystoma xenopodis]|uniref:Uncharacterized protein n=1 Tax=Protopolystoma xenopodis TaxID=117903 RepID=A0A3S5FCM7_9PLAT|nr:unnamed protein product [Protopolystoma xenopodis]
MSLTRRLICTLGKPRPVLACTTTWITEHQPVWNGISGNNLKAGQTRGPDTVGQREGDMKCGVDTAFVSRMDIHHWRQTPVRVSVCLSLCRDGRDLSNSRRHRMRVGEVWPPINSGRWQLWIARNTRSADSAFFISQCRLSSSAEFGSSSSQADEAYAN